MTLKPKHFTKEWGNIQSAVKGNDFAKVSAV